LRTAQLFELPELCEAKRSRRRRRAQISVGRTLPGRVRGGIAGRHRRTTQGLACARERLRILRAEARYELTTLNMSDCDAGGGALLLSVA
jgi:hypothetical protein